MKRAIVALVSVAAVFAFCAPVASARILDAGAEVCKGTATWQVNLSLTGTSYADITYTSGSTGCKAVTAAVEDDMNFGAGSRDYAASGSVRVFLTAVAVTGNTAFAGAATSPLRGPVAAANGILNAVLETPFPVGYHDEEVHRGTGTCAGTSCFTTEFVRDQAASHP